MKADAEEEIWIGFGNEIEWVVFSDCDTPLEDLSSITRVVVKIGSLVVDSATNGVGLMTWDGFVTDKQLPDGSTFTGNVIRAKLGLVDGLVAGEFEDCCLITFDPSYPNGLVVSDDITFTIHSDCRIT